MTAIRIIAMPDIGFVLVVDMPMNLINPFVSIAIKIAISEII